MTKKFWVFGRNTVLTILSENKRKVYQINLLNEKHLSIIDKKFHKICNIVNKKNFLKNLNTDLSHQGISAHIGELDQNDLKTLNGNAIILDNIYDHRNIGSILRSSVAFGINNIIINKKDLSINSQLMFKTASGATEKVKFFLVTNIANSINFLKKEKNFTCIAFDGNATQNIFECKKIFIENKILFIFGSEDKGIRRLTKNLSDYILKIPIKNIESLNVSNAVCSVLTLFNYFNLDKESKNKGS